MTAAAAGNPPDLSTSNNVWMAEFVKKGYLEPLDDLIASAGINLKDFFPGGVESCQFGGHTYGLPFDISAWQWLYWNKDIFAKYGLDPETPPKTFDELLSFAQKCNHPADGIYGIPVYGQAQLGGWSDATSVSINAFIRSAGAEPIDVQSNKSVMSGNPGVKTALQFYKNMAQYSPPGVLQANEVTSEQLFTSGKVAMCWDGDWAEDTWNINAPIMRWGVALIPTPQAGMTAHGSFGGWNLILWKDSPHKDIAWKMMQFLIRPDIISEVVTLDPGIITFAKDFLQTKRKGGDVILQFLNNSPPHVGFRSAGYEDISNFDALLVQDVLSGMDIDQATAKADAAINSVLQKNPVVT